MRLDFAWPTYIHLRYVYNAQCESTPVVRLNGDGGGKSETVYCLLESVRELEGSPIVEPSKRLVEADTRIKCVGPILQSYTSAHK